MVVAAEKGEMMPYRALIPGMLGDVPFEAGDIFALTPEVAENWLTCGMLVATDDPDCPVTIKTPKGAIPEQPQPQQSPEEGLEATPSDTAIPAETPAVVEEPPPAPPEDEPFAVDEAST